MTYKFFTQFSFQFDTKLSEWYKGCRWMNKILSHSLTKYMNREMSNNKNNKFLQNIANAQHPQDVCRHDTELSNWNELAEKDLQIDEKFTQHDHIVDYSRYSKGPRILKYLEVYSLCILKMVVFVDILHNNIVCLYYKIFKIHKYMIIIFLPQDGSTF